jgi:diaminopimelate decarboxylase
MNSEQGVNKLPIFPKTAKIEQGRLVIGGCDTVDLISKFGTPLYIFDEWSLRSKCREFITEFKQRYPKTVVVYAAKAFINRALAVLFHEEGLGLDVVSAGELSIARSVNFPLEKIYFHGNNKSSSELEEAVECSVGRIIVDNFNELVDLNKIAVKLNKKPDILLRISPGVDPHTHSYITTGVVDSKFGFPLVNGKEAITRALSASNLNLLGLHFHLGSSIFQTEPYREAIEAIFDLVASVRQDGFKLEELDVGGGFAIQYELDQPAPPLAMYAELIGLEVIKKCQDLALKLPRLVIEPGRALIGQAGVALYTVGVIKDIPGIRRYISVDGGMGDNIRPALYGSRYEAALANRMMDNETEAVTIAGKFCESGDILVKDVILPPVSSGDIVALPNCGAYCLSMASNYNASLKPAIVMVGEGKARPIRRREIPDDLTRCDLL